MQKIILMPIGFGKAQQHLNTTLLNPVSKETIKKYVSAEDFSELDKLYQEESVLVWGLVPGKQNDKDWENLNLEDIVIFVPSNDNLIVTHVTYKMINEKLSKVLWGTEDKTEKTWERIFFVRLVSVLELRKRALLSQLGYSDRDNLQGHRDVTERFIEAYGSLDEFNRTYSDLKIELEELNQETSEKFIDSVLPSKNRQGALKEKIAESEREQTEYVELKGRRIKRNQLIVAYVKEKASYKCQACGFSFTKKDGSKYVEAAHIKQLAKSHMDTLENLVALCPNCHKKFDLGDMGARKTVIEALEKQGLQMEEK